VKGTPKSEASIRKVVLPELIVPELRRHLNTFAAAGPDGFVFVGVKVASSGAATSPSLGRGHWPRPGSRLRFTSMIFAIPGTQ
jgi:hypothetical protein